MSNEFYVTINLHEVILKECVRCGSNRSPIDEHHITYTPCKKVYLCRPCHIGITVINGTYAQDRLMSFLDNKVRRALHKRFMKCKWRMEDEDHPIIELKRRRGMVYRNRLRKLQKEFFRKVAI
jgi:hypothetical protein